MFNSVLNIYEGRGHSIHNKQGPKASRRRVGEDERPVHTGLDAGADWPQGMQTTRRQLGTRAMDQSHPALSLLFFGQCRRRPL